MVYYSPKGSAIRCWECNSLVAFCEQSDFHTMIDPNKIFPIFIDDSTTTRLHANYCPECGASLFGDVGHFKFDESWTNIL